MDHCKAAKQALLTWHVMLRSSVGQRSTQHFKPATCEHGECHVFGASGGTATSGGSAFSGGS